MNALSLSSARLRVSFRTIPYVAIEVDEETLDELATSNLVEFIEEDTLAAPTLASTIPLVRADVVWSRAIEGAGHTLAILDTGVEAGHAFFGGRVVSEACYSTNSAAYASTSLCPNNQESMVGSGAASPTKCSGASGCDHGQPPSRTLLWEGRFWTRLGSRRLGAKEAPASSSFSATHGTRVPWVSSRGVFLHQKSRSCLPTRRHRRAAGFQ